MSVTLLYGEQPSQTTAAKVEGENLWLSLDELKTATGWELKSQGACLDDVCIPIPAGRESEFLRSDGKEFNLATFARLRGQPVVHNDTHAVWCFGETAGARHDALTALQAPDFTLPDLDEKQHSLSEHRGKKVLLICWASW